MGVFKGFLTKAYYIFTPVDLKEEIDFLVDMFVEDGYDRMKFQNIAKNFVPQTAHTPVRINEDEPSPIVKLPWILRISPSLRK